MNRHGGAVASVARFSAVWDRKRDTCGNEAPRAKEKSGVQITLSRNDMGEAFGVRGRGSGKHRFGTSTAAVAPTTTESAASLNSGGARRKRIPSLMRLTKKLKSRGQAVSPELIRFGERSEGPHSGGTSDKRKGGELTPLLPKRLRHTGRVVSARKNLAKSRPRRTIGASCNRVSRCRV